MIVGSLLLILVAVTLLILGLIGGSSGLLTSSIVVSLLAAVALVVGARQAAGDRSATAPGPEPLAVDLDDDPGPVPPVEETMAWAAESATADRSPSGEDPAPADPAAAETVVGVGHSGADTDVPATAPAQSAATAGNSADTEVLHRDADSTRDADADDAQHDGHERAHERARDRLQEAVGFGYEQDRPGVDLFGNDRVGAPVRAEPDDPYADFHREQSPVGAPRRSDAEPSDSWLHVPEQDRRVDREPGSRNAAAHEVGSRNAGSSAFGVDHSGPDRSRADDIDDEEFGHDDEDPADEPPPQRVQPADAVRVSQMIAEVLVVDGRPRYHLGDCASLSGRITEPLPVSEAVELGFTSCSMCRPAGRLVAEAAHR